MERGTPTAFTLTLQRLSVIALFLLAGVAAMVGYQYWQQQQQQTSFNEQFLPTLATQQNINQLVTDNSQLLYQLTTARNASEWLAQHQQLSDNWQRLAELISDGGTLFTELQRQISKQDSNVIRIVELDRQNQQLSQQLQIQLELLTVGLNDTLPSLTEKIAQLTRQQAEKNIRADIVLTRATALSNVTAEQHRYQQMLLLVTAANGLNQQLSLQTSMADFNHLTQQLEQLFTLSASLRAMEGNPIITQLEQLDKLVNSEQRMLSKWRGYLRLGHEYRQLLAEHQQQLTTWRATQPKSGLLRSTAELGQTSLLPILLIGLLVLSVAGFVFRALKLAMHFVNDLQTLPSKIIAPQSQPSSQPLAFAEHQSLLTTLTTQQSVVKPQVMESPLQRALINDVRRIAEQQKVLSWQLPQYRVDEQLLMNLRTVLGDHGQRHNSVSWRFWFDRRDRLAILLAAKTARHKQQAQSLMVRSFQGKFVNLIVNYQQGQWFGTLAEQQQIVEYKQQVELLSAHCQQVEKQALSASLDWSELLLTNLRQAQLQTQHVSVASRTPLPQVARQLNRLIKLIRQQQVVANLLSGQQHLQPEAINLSSEMFAAALNMSVEALRQQNTVDLFIDPHISDQLIADSQHLQLLLTAISRLFLLKEFKARLLITLSLVDRNIGQNIVAFNFKLMRELAGGSAPDGIRQLLADIDSKMPTSIVLPTSVVFVRTLLNAFHCQEINGSHLERGYQFQFVMPLALSQHHKTQDAEYDLQGERFLLLTQDRVLKDALTTIVRSGQGKLEVLAEPEHFVRQFSVQQLSQLPLSTVIIAPDCHHNAFNLVAKHINSLPTKFQPKVMRLQATFRANFERQGLYADVNTPLLSHHFLSRLTQLVKGNSSHNNLLTAQQCQQYQYQVNQTEVLLAMNDVHNCQIVWRMLRWLGLQVTVVTNERDMIHLWRSGQFMVLLTEFNHSPFVSMQAGVSIPRGVFALHSNLLENLSEKEKQCAEHWYLATIYRISDTVQLLPQLIESLRPWLLAKEVAEAPTLATPLESEEKPVIDRLPSSTVSIDLERFADIQGSPQIAGLMLEEYINDNRRAFALLTDAVVNKEITQAQEAIVELTENAAILGVEPILQRCQELSAALLAQDYKVLNPLLATTSQLVNELETFANDI